MQDRVQSEIREWVSYEYVLNPTMITEVPDNIHNHLRYLEK
jgi:hypothetical protein